MADRLVVVCYWWTDPERNRGYQFGPEHVRIWDSMVGRNLTIPHRRVCITDRPDEIGFMETVRIDFAKHVPGTCFVKLMHWRPDIGDILGQRIMVTDLDCVVTGSLEPLASRTEDVVLWRNPNFGTPRRAFYNTSIMLLTAGARPHLWTEFDPVKSRGFANRRFGGSDQAWVSEKLSWDEAHWTDADGIYGAGRLVSGRMGKGVGTTLPDNARIVFTPGDREPSQAAMRERHPWIDRFYH